MTVCARGALLFVVLLIGGPASAQFGIPRSTGSRIQPRIPTSPTRPYNPANQTQPQAGRLGNVAIETNPQPVTLPGTRPGTPVVVPQQGTNQPGTARPGVIGIQTQTTQPKTTTSKSTPTITPPKISVPKINPPKISPPKIKTPKLF
jgi:hypothetical protein